MNGGLPGTFTVGTIEDAKKRHLVPYRCDLCGAEDVIDSRIFQGRKLDEEFERRMRSHKCRKPDKKPRGVVPTGEGKQPLREFEAGNLRDVAERRKR